MIATERFGRVGDRSCSRPTTPGGPDLTTEPWRKAVGVPAHQKLVAVERCEGGDPVVGIAGPSVPSPVVALKRETGIGSPGVVAALDRGCGIDDSLLLPKVPPKPRGRSTGGLLPGDQNDDWVRAVEPRRESDIQGLGSESVVPASDWANATARGVAGVTAMLTERRS